MEYAAEFSAAKNAKGKNRDNRAGHWRIPPVLCLNGFTSIFFLTKLFILRLLRLVKTKDATARMLATWRTERASK